MVDYQIQTTGVVAQHEGWSYWKDTILPTVDCRRLGGDEPFAARRSLTALTSGLFVDTASSAIEIHRTSRQVAKDDRDDATLSVFVAGHGAADPKNSGGYPLTTGDIALCDIGRGFRMSGATPYRELRIYVPRPTFAVRVGPIDDLLDLRLPADAPLVALFTRYLQGLAVALPTLSRQDADAGLDGVLHLLSSLVASRTGRQHDEGEQASGGAVMRLANSHIAAMLGDPTFDGATLMRTIGMSRSALYRVFADRGGIAAAIRDARLDRARARLLAPADRHRNLAQIAYLCGFQDYPAFTRAFRRRFGMTPRDCRGR